MARQIIMVTGVSGFVGRHMAEALAQDHTVVGVGHSHHPPADLGAMLDRYIACDLTDSASVKRLPLGNLTAVINLAGLSQVGNSYQQAERYSMVNVGVLTNLGQQLLKNGSGARVLAISSGAVYDPEQEMPLHEASRTKARSPYAASKLLMEAAADELRKQGLDCVIARPFNHIGPGQQPGFLVPDLYRQICAAGQSGEPLKVGNLKTRRDYTDVRDVARAYADLALTAKLDSTLYNVCSGRSVEGIKILELLLKACGQTGQIAVTTDPALVRPNDAKDLYGSSERLLRETGWEPSISLEQTIADFVAYERSKR